MLDFTGRDQPAQLVCLHYAERLNKASKLIDILACKSEVTSKEEARDLANFFWDMLDTSAAESEQPPEISGVGDVHFWVERNLSIFAGYLINAGYEVQWDMVADEH